MAGTRIASLASLSGEPSLGQRHDAETGGQVDRRWEDGKADCCGLGVAGARGGAASRAWHGNRAQTTGKMESVDPLTFVTSRRAGWRRVPCATGGLRGLATSRSGYRGPWEPCLGHGGGSGEPEDA